MTTPHLLDEKDCASYLNCRIPVVQFVLFFNLEFPKFPAKRQSDLSSFHHHTKCDAEFVSHACTYICVDMFLFITYTTRSRMRTCDTCGPHLCAMCFALWSGK